MLFKKRASEFVPSKSITFARGFSEFSESGLSHLSKMDLKEKRKIRAIEEQILGEKPWQLRGEIGAHARPVNSLLFEDVKFDQHVKAPKITPETTESLEALIKQRIKDNKFDDPIKKIKPAQAISKARQVEVSSEKSKVGLAELYEQELIGKVSSKPVRDGAEKDVERKLLALFRKLDAMNDR